MLGKIISHYKIMEKLGEGGMGIVYKAQDTKLKRTVALKFLPSHLTKNETDKARFLQEAQAAAALNHNNVCTIHEIHDEGDNPFIVMEYVEGKTLRDIVHDNLPKVQNLREVVEYAIQITKALKAAHKKGIIHRDIKSENIMVTETGQVKVMDFGLAKLQDSAKLTRTGSTTGTAAYMSPEQFQGKEVDHRTDIWSLGVVLYEMITGQLPFKGEYEQSVMYSIMNEEPEPITELRTNVTEELDRIVKKALAKNRDERYQQVDEMMNDLRKFSKESETPASILPSSIVNKLADNKLIRRAALPVVIVLLFLLGFFLLKPLLFKEVWVGEPKPIAVISFENQTGNKSYDYLQKAIPNLLITSLEQSKYLSVTTWERMYDLLKQMGRENVELIDRDLGFELCRIDGLDAIVIGSFIKAGDMFATDVKVLDVESKKILKSVSSKGKGVDSILKRQIDELSKGISRGVGISEYRIETSQKPIIDVTTTSLDAYNFFLKGRENYEKQYYDDARLFFEKTMELDPYFAEAYLYLSWTYNNLWNFKKRDAMYDKAKSLSEKAPDKARLYIEAFYAKDIEKNKEKYFHLLQKIEKKYPREKQIYYEMGNHYMEDGLYMEAIKEFKKALELDPDYGYVINQLAYSYSHMGNLEKAIEYFKKYASVSPGNADPHDSMGDLYVKTGKLKEALDKYEKALDLKPDFGSEWKISYIYALKKDYNESLKWIDQFIIRSPSPGSKAIGYIWQGFYHYWTGNYKSALDDLGRADELLQAVENDIWLAWTYWMRGWIYYDTKKYELSRKHFKNWSDILMKSFPPSRTFFKTLYNVYLCYLDLKQNQIDTLKSKLKMVKTLLADLSSESKEQMTFRYNLLKAEVLISEGFFDQAISVLKKAPPQGRLPNMFPWYIIPYNVPFLKDALARAYLSKGEIDKAIDEYKQLISFDVCSRHHLIHPKYHYRLAKLYEDKGLSAKAMEEYGKFLGFWENADEDMPEVVDAKVRLAKLNMVISVKGGK